MIGYAQYQELMKVFSEFYFNLVDLRQELETTCDLGEVRRKTVNELKAVDQHLRDFKNELTNENRRNALYILTAFADEIMIYSSYAGTERWEDSPLEEQFNLTHMAGKRIFEKIDECVRTYDDSNLGMITLYFLVLALGFKGQYRYGKSTILIQLQSELYRLICSTDSSFPRQFNYLFPDAYTVPRGPSEKEKPYFGVAYYFLAVLLTLICVIPAVTPTHTFYDVIPPPQQLVNIPAYLVSSVGILWQYRHITAFAILFIAVVLAIYRMNVIIFWPSPKSILMRFSLGKLFSLLRADLDALSAQFRHRSPIPRYLFLTCDPAKGDDQQPRADQRHLIRQSGLKILASHTVEIEPALQRFCGYAVLENGIIFDAPLSQTGNLSGFRFYNSLLRHMKKHRADKRGSRAVDGIIVAVPFRSMVASAKKMGNELAAQEEAGFMTSQAQLIDDLYAQIRFIQQQRKSNLPLYLVLTGCDDISCFYSWCDMIPDEYQGQIFGWSRPEEGGIPGEMQNPASAFTHIKARLNQILLYFLSCGHNDQRHHQFLAFVKEFSGIEAGLSNFVRVLGEKSKPVNGEAILLRGIYFSGNERQPSGSERALFLKALINDKIFAESKKCVDYVPSFYDRISATWHIGAGSFA